MIRSTGDQPEYRQRWMLRIQKAGTNWKYLEEYKSARAPRRKIGGSSARDTDDGGVTPRGPIAIVGCEGVKRMNGTKKSAEGPQEE